ncbi:MAG: class I SAM-dependent methyltransferase [Lewinella sp.]|nr:class I SAM-dependent methyltransferase [Lewinella sp.]
MSEFQPQRLALKVKTSAERYLRHGHPWVFADSIVKHNAEGQAGDLAIIFDQQKNKFLAIGLYDPFSPIRVRVLAAGQPTRVDHHWLAAGIQAAFDRRQPLLTTDTNSYRLLYGEGDGFSGLIVDVYAEVLVVKLYAHAWVPWLSQLLSPLLAVSGCATAVLRLSRKLQQAPEGLNGLQDGQVLAGELASEEVIFREHGLRFVANVIRGHKTGYFLDHRHNRHQVGSLAGGQRVLDVFAYAGGFSVHALAGGATEVISLDISAPALAMAERNVALNGLSAHHYTLAEDAFQAMERLQLAGEQFGIVIVDPPSFAKREQEVEGARKSYERLVRLAIPLVARGGLLVMASCSSRVPAADFFDLVNAALTRSRRSFTELERTQHDIDHPIREDFPEGAYLKCGYYRL